MKYFDEVLVITMMTMPLAFLSFEKKFVKYPAFFNILITMPCAFPFYFALFEGFLKAGCLMMQSHRANGLRRNLSRVFASLKHDY